MGLRRAVRCVRDRDGAGPSRARARDRARDRDDAAAGAFDQRQPRALQVERASHVRSRGRSDPRMREWMIREGIADAAMLDEFEKHDRSEVEQIRERAYETFQDRSAAAGTRPSRSSGRPRASPVSRSMRSHRGCATPRTRSAIGPSTRAVFRALVSLRGREGPARAELARFVRTTARRTRPDTTRTSSEIRRVAAARAARVARVPDEARGHRRTPRVAPLLRRETSRVTRASYPRRRRRTTRRCQPRLRGTPGEARVTADHRHGDPRSDHPRTGHRRRAPRAATDRRHPVRGLPAVRAPAGVRRSRDAAASDRRWADGAGRHPDQRPPAAGDLAHRVADADDPRNAAWHARVRAARHGAGRGFLQHAPS